MEDEHDIENARRYFAKKNLEEERPTRLFCSMNRKMKSKAQFETIHVKEENERGEEVIRVVTKQSAVECEIMKFYWSLYRKEETFCNKRDILENIGEVKMISEEESWQLENKIMMEDGRRGGGDRKDRNGRIGDGDRKNGKWGEGRRG